MEKKGVPNPLYIHIIHIGVCISITSLIMSGTAVADELAPAVFVFGDSLADVGNNNHLQLSLAKANFPHNGIDFPTRRPTGRFSNGKNAADFLAEKLGLPTPPAYLHLMHAKVFDFQKGVNFASGGAGIFNGTDQLYRQSIPFTKQIEYYSSVRDQMGVQLGISGLAKLQSKAVHVVIIGSNDVLGYHGSAPDFSNTFDPAQFVGFMVATMRSQLQRLHDIGGRKFMVMGVGAVGCCPSQRIKSDTGECNAGANAMAWAYNQGLRLVLEELKTGLQGFHYTFFDTYTVLLNFIQNPAAYGFTEVKGACCGLGELRAKVACVPISRYCSNRKEHLFWDMYHPTEAADRIVVDTAFDAPPHYSYPFGLQHLVSL